MHALHLRLPKNFVLEERLDRYADAIEAFPTSYAGRWAEACAPLTAQGLGRFREARLDLGCGKGAFLIEAARREPDVLWVGIDNEPICIAYTAQGICEAGLANAVVVPGSAEHVLSYFAQGELARIYLNFPTPFPKRRHATYRLTHARNLLLLRRVLAPTGTIVFKTDSEPLYLYSRPQFPVAGFHTLWTSEDVRADRPGDPVSGYERKLTAQGAQVYGIYAEPTPEPAPDPADIDAAESDIEQSLVKYLPDDLHSLGYVPHGMEATVVNLRNQRDKADQGRR
ncbi:MAG: methyltransferase [Olegusella sp.]|nr:methyltransferase [Olegusella sp.]